MKLTQDQILRNQKYSERTGIKLDEDGYIIVEENKPIVFLGQITKTQVIESDGEQKT